MRAKESFSQNVPEGIFEKVNFEKSQQMTTKI